MACIDASRRVRTRPTQHLVLCDCGLIHRIQLPSCGACGGIACPSRLEVFTEREEALCWRCFKLAPEVRQAKVFARRAGFQRPSA